MDKTQELAPINWMNTDVTGRLPSLAMLRFDGEALLVIGEIDSFKGAWPLFARMTPGQLAAFEEQALADGARAAGSLEGPRAGNTDAEKAAAERYRAALTAALDGANPVSVAWILTLHRILMAAEDDPGILKTAPNAVEAFDATGKTLGVVFTTETPESTARRLSELAAWTQSALTGNETHPVVAIALFAALFLEIHPFRAGTMRLASVLTTCLLIRAGYDYARYGALDGAIESGKYSYYLSLRRSLGALHAGQPDWSHWLEFFLRALRQHKRDLEGRIFAARAVDDDLPALSARILAIARAHGRVTIAAAATATSVSRNTIKDHVGRLVEHGHLALHGAGRGAWYGLR